MSDALYIADALVSYNFEHIVNLETIIKVNEVNKAHNMNEIFVCQPQDVIISDD